MPIEERIRGFISYAHADVTDVSRLDVHLRATERLLPVSFWRDQRNLRTGHSLSGEIATAISASHVFVLVVTPDFFNSDYIFEHELPAIRKRVEDINGLLLIVVVRKSRWKEFVGQGDLVAAPLDKAGQLVPARDWPKEDGFNAAGEQCHQAIKARYSLGTVNILARRPQEKGGLAFEPETGPEGAQPRYFTVATKAVRDDAEAAQRPETRQRQTDARSKAELLAGQTARLGNNQTWGGLAATAQRTAELLKLDTAAIAAEAFPLWSLSQSLATYAAQDDRLSQTPASERNGDPLAAEQRRALDDLMTVLPVLVRRFPSVRHDDTLLSAERSRSVDRKEIDDFLERIDEIRLLSPETQKTVKALHASPHGGAESTAERRLDEIVVGTARNIGNAALGSAAGWVTRQSARAETADAAPSDTALDRKTKALVTNGGETLASLYRDIPDMARAIDVLAHRIAHRHYAPILPVDLVPPTHEPPAGFDLDVVRQMILRGEAPPQEWATFIDRLDLSSAALADLGPIGGLTQLDYLDLRSTKVADLGPIATLTRLRHLDLSSTNVVDLAPIAALTHLQSLSLNRTRITDFAPIAALTHLQRLDLDATKIGDISLIAGLTQLQSLSLNHTQVANFRQLTALTQLQSLSLDDTQVTDLAPIAGLARLQSLSLKHTRVTDFDPIAGLTQLQHLDLDSTKISTLAPVAGLAQLQSLTLTGTSVADLAPITGLTQLQGLHLNNTGITDLAPIAGLTRLKSLSLNHTRVADFAPISGLTQLKSLSLANTPVADLAFITGLAQLQSLALNHTPVTDFDCIGSLDKLQRLYLNHTQVANLTPIAGLTQLQYLGLDSTKVTDLAPITGLPQLQYLDVDSTQVVDFAPIAGLTQLQALFLNRTQITDLAPIADLKLLQGLYLNGTRVASLAPIAGLAQLQRLHFNETPIADLAPIAGLTKLQSLFLNHTQITDLAPIAGLTQLQDLSLSTTRVANLTSIATLDQLAHLDISFTQIADLAPVAGLRSLQTIGVGNRTRALRFALEMPTQWSVEGNGYLRRSESQKPLSDTSNGITRGIVRTGWNWILKSIR
jgi:Leucine-rich repeat (LRR) protein